MCSSVSFKLIEQHQTTAANLRERLVDVQPLETVSALSEMFSCLTRASSDARTSSSRTGSSFSSWLSFVAQNRAHNDKRITALQSN
jgi:hypothetical protein